MAAPELRAYQREAIEQRAHAAHASARHDAPWRYEPPPLGRPRSDAPLSCFIAA